MAEGDTMDMEEFERRRDRAAELVRQARIDAYAIALIPVMFADSRYDTLADDAKCLWEWAAAIEKAREDSFR